MNRLVLIVGCALSAVLLPLSTSAAPRTLPCINYGDCQPRTYPAYLLFEMDFADPAHYRAWLARIGRPIVRGPSEALHQECAARLNERDHAPKANGSARARSIGVAEGIGNVCVLPIPRTRTTARAWCQQNGWQFHRHDGGMKVVCVMGAGA